VSTHDDGSELEFFEEPETAEAPGRQRRRVRPSRGGGPRRPSPPPQGAVALARLAGLVALAIVVVVGLVFWVDSCQGQSRHDEYASYMDSVRPIAQSSASALDAYSKVLGSRQLTLGALQTKLDLWSRQQQEDYDRALRLVPPAPLQAAHQEVLATLQLRAIGLAGMANALATAGSKSSDQVASDLAKQAQVLSASDLVWSQLFRLPATETMRKLRVIGVIAPPSQIVTNPEVITPASFSEVYSRLNNSSSSSSGKVSGKHGSQLLSTVAVSGGQTKTLSISSPTKVNVAADLAFKVTFKNAGDFQEVKVPVTFTVSVFGKQKFQKTDHVSSINPGQTTVVSFTNLQLSSAFGGQATVSVVVGKVPGETVLSNNHDSYPVFFSLPSG
jgi:hypothetical protein